MTKEELQNFVLRKSNIVDLDTIIKQIPFLSDKVIISSENPQTSGLHGFQGDLLYSTTTNKLYANQILNKVPITDMTYTSHTYTSGAIVTGNENNLVNNTGLVIELSNGGDYAQWLFSCPTGYRQLFCTLTIELGAFYNNTASLDNFIIEFSPNGNQWYNICKLSKLPTPAGSSSDILVDLTKYNLANNSNLTNMPSLRICNIGLINTNLFKIKNLTYCAQPVDSDWNVLIDFNQLGTWFNTWAIANIGFINVSNYTFKTHNNTGVTSDSCGTVLFPYNGYYEIKSFVNITDWVTITTPHDTELSNINADLLTVNQDSSAISPVVIDISGNITAGATGVKWYKNALQGSKKILVNSTNGNMGVDLNYNAQSSTTWLNIVGGFIEAKYLGPTLNNL